MREHKYISALRFAVMVISIANLKTHSVTLFTGTCKNLVGLLPDRNKEIYHPDIDKVIHDLVKTVPTQLNILDGFYAMEENGPIQGRPINLKCRVYSVKPTIADIVGCKMINMNYRKVKHIWHLASNDYLRYDSEYPRYRIAYPGKCLRFFNLIGLFIQKIGMILYNYGNRVHCSISLFYFVIISMRPLLLMFFDLKMLKRWKRKLMK